jgi:hypothetical protein
LEAEPALLALSLYLMVGEGLRRGEYVASRPFASSVDKRASAGRGERSDMSYSLGFLRIGGLVRLCNGRIGALPGSPRRGKNEGFADMAAVLGKC